MCLGGESSQGLPGLLGDLWRECYPGGDALHLKTSPSAPPFTGVCGRGHGLCAAGEAEVPGQEESEEPGQWLHLVEEESQVPVCPGVQVGHCVSTPPDTTSFNNTYYNT